MDRRRKLTRLAELNAMQELQLMEVRVSLAGAVDELRLAGERVGACLRELGQCESEFDALLGGNLFDPDAMGRSGYAIMLAEDRLGASRDEEAQARRTESEMRIGWHRERQRLATIARQRRNLGRKSDRVSEDRASVDLLALAGARERVS